MADPLGPMSGQLVLDFGVFGSGPKTGLLLAWMGADVIKVESPRFPDQFRGAATLTAPFEGSGVAPWDQSAGVNSNNRGKSHLCLDYATEQGAEVLDRLIEQADVILHNFRMSVADKIGLTWARCSAVNPRIILIAISSQGETGPHRDYSSYGTTLEGLGGVASLMPGDDGPLITGVNFPDQAAPIIASAVIAMALIERERTGNGMSIDLAQIEATAMLASLPVQVPQARPQPRLICTPDEVRGVFRCDGFDEWIAIDASNSELVSALANAISAPHATLSEDALRAWALRHDKFEAERTLRTAGVPAAAVRHGPEVIRDPILEARGYFERLEDCLIGNGAQNGNPLGLGLGARQLSGARPMGADNVHILKNRLGMGEKRIAELERQGIVSNRPLLGSAVRSAQ